MRKSPLLHTCGLAAFIASLAAACTTTPPVPAPAEPEPEFHADATIKDLMLGIVDTNADVVWLAVTTIQNDQGTVETRPKNDEEWATVRRGALALMEATNLLKMPRKVAQPHEKSETPGIELEPAEMDVLIAKDRPAWNRHVEDLYAAVNLALQAIDAKDADTLFELGEKIEAACENCHKTYWYPNEVIPEFKFEDLAPTGQSAPPPTP